MALSGDYFIQGAPTITAKAAGTSVPMLTRASLPLWGIMSFVTLLVAFIMFRKDLKTLPQLKADISSQEEITASRAAKLVAVITPLAFLTDIIFMLKMDLQGGDATALVGGTAFLLLMIICVLDSGFTQALEDVTDYLKDGFGFGIKIFAPVIVIGGFFFLGGEGAAKAVFGPQATGLLSDIGTYLAQNVPLSKFPVVLAQAAVAIITGLDGSGFSGLPLVGATAQTFSDALVINKEVLASMGQLITIWVGGGTIIPWAVVPVAAICNVSPQELVRKNAIPVFCGIVCVIILSLFLI